MKMNAKCEIVLRLAFYKKNITNEEWISFASLILIDVQSKREKFKLLSQIDHDKTKNQRIVFY